MEAIGMQTPEEIVDKLARIMRVSSRVRLDMLQGALKMPASDFNEKIFEWAEEFKFRIDGDFVDFSGGNIGGFIAELDAAFANWGQDGGKKTEKAEKALDAVPQALPQSNAKVNEFGHLRKAFFLENLDATTRKFMLQELTQDIAKSDLYISNRLTPLGLKKYPGELQKAIERGDVASLTKDLKRKGYLKTTEERKSKSGETIKAKVPSNAAIILAEGEFNRYYIRGVCLRAIDEGVKDLEVYRAKFVNDPRPQSQRVVGMKVDPKTVLDLLRKNKTVDSVLGLSPGPNSGLSVRLSN